MILNIEDVLQESRLKDIKRFNTRSTIKQESVAEHSYFVVLYCIKICDKLNILEEGLRNDILVKAALHDIPEIDTSDIPHDVKQRSKELSDAIYEMEKQFYTDKFPQYIHLFNRNNENERWQKVNTIVELADAYSVLQYILIECKLGNVSDEIFEIRREVKERIYKIEERLEMHNANK
jgi:5'-deoxynucleotidase YfbR-like HD superfamily hydrolase